MDRRGQFYLIAAVIIIAAIITTVTVSNYIITQPKQTRLYDLGEELKTEGASVINYGLYNEQDRFKIVQNFADQFKDYTAEQLENILFVYGGENNLSIYGFSKKESGEVSITIGGVPFVIPSGGIEAEPKTFSREGGIVYVKTPKNFTYNFELKKGENFYFIIDKGGYVVQG